MIASGRPEASITAYCSPARSRSAALAGDTAPTARRACGSHPSQYDTSTRSMTTTSRLNPILHGQTHARLKGKPPHNGIRPPVTFLPRRRPTRRSRSDAVSMAGRTSNGPRHTGLLRACSWSHGAGHVRTAAQVAQARTGPFDPPIPVFELRISRSCAITDLGADEPVLRFSRVVLLPTALRADRDLFARAYRTQDCWLSYAWPSPPPMSWAITHGWSFGLLGRRRYRTRSVTSRLRCLWRSARSARSSGRCVRRG